jgi:3-oxoacyl-[acyl-carrier protein] reductase
MFPGLDGKRVLITGASGGIGSCLARLFAEYGALLGLHYHQNRAETETLVREIEKVGGEAVSIQADLCAPALPNLLQTFTERFGGIDILVNNAGAVIGAVDFLDLEPQMWEQTFRLNVQNPYFLAREAFVVMKMQGGGKIINISSISAKYGGSTKTLHYGAAKAALEAVTTGLARQGAPHNILVNAVRGGFIDTPMHHKIGRANLQRRIDMIPLKRAGTPVDVARMVLFLASEACDFITGEILTVAGGD